MPMDSRNSGGLSVLYLSRKALQPEMMRVIWRSKVVFQSSTYRGRHCNGTVGRDGVASKRGFQSSTYRGRHCNFEHAGLSCLILRHLSVLYLSRKALQHHAEIIVRALRQLSVLYLSRKALQLGNSTRPRLGRRKLSVLYLSRKALQHNSFDSQADHAGAFSPLLIEEGTATLMG